MSVRSDAELARAWQSGDRTAFAEVYEKYASSLYGVAVGVVRDRSAASDVVHDTFVRAARKIGALRDPDRLRAWLFAILRNEATDLLRGRSRESAEDVAAMSEQLPADLPELHTELSRSELSDVVWSAAGALQQRDREVLELHLRAGLEAGDLADALGVTPGHAAVLLSRMRDRMEKAIGALLIARLGRRECGALDGLLASWDGRFTLDVRSRVTRHVESCPVCTRGRLQLATYQRLAPAVLPVFLVPELLRDKVLGSVALVSQQLAVGGGSGAGGQVDPWSWHDDGFPQPRPSRPLEVGPEGDDAAAGGATAGATLAAGTGAALLAAGLGGHPPQPVVDPWTLPAGPGGPPGPSPPPPGAPAPGPHRMPGQRRGVRTPLLVVAAIVLLLGGGIGTWKVASASPDPAASAAGSGAGSTLGTGDGPTGPTSTTIDPTTAMTTTGTATTSLTPTTSAPTRSSPTTATSTTTTATTAAAAAHLGVSASGLAFGKQTSATVTTRTVTLTNDGGQKLSWTASVTGAGFAVTAGSGTLGPGTSATVTVTLNRSGLAEGAVSGSLALHASPTGQAFAVALTGTVANPPVISIDSFSSPLAYSGAPATGSCTSQTGGLKATVTDDSGPNGVVSVTVSWTDGKATTTKALNQDGTPWYGSYGPFATMTSYRLTVSAKDVQGNVGTAGFTVSVQRC